MLHETRRKGVREVVVHKPERTKLKIMHETLENNGTYIRWHPLL